MSGICSAHRHHEPGCPRCGVILSEGPATVTHHCPPHVPCEHGVEGPATVTPRMSMGWNPCPNHASQNLTEGPCRECALAERGPATVTPFYWNTETGEPCPRRGNVLCTLPYSPEHRHAHREGPATVTLTDDEKRALRDLTFGFDFQARLDSTVERIVAARVAALTADLATARAKWIADCGRDVAAAYRTGLADARRNDGRVIANVRALAETWRYKGEFGWGPWQTGEGPDQEGEVLDRASTALRALLPAAPTGEGE